MDELSTGLNEQTVWIRVNNVRPWSVGAHFSERRPLGRSELRLWGLCASQVVKSLAYWTFWTSWTSWSLVWNQMSGDFIYLFRPLSGLVIMQSVQDFTDFFVIVDFGYRCYPLQYESRSKTRHTTCFSPGMLERLFSDMTQISYHNTRRRCHTAQYVFSQ